MLEFGQVIWAGCDPAMPVCGWWLGLSYLYHHQRIELKICQGLACGYYCFMMVVDMEYAVYDVKGKCWIGDDKGVKTYPDQDLARGAATIITEQFNGRRGAFRARPYDGSAKKFKDTIYTQMSPLQALRRIEGTNDKS